MNVLVKSFQSLQDDLSRRNETAQAADSIKALASVVDILKTSHIPETTFTKLTLILRSRMLPLYRIALKSALRYAAAVLGAISDIKSQNPDDVKQKESCDNAHKSLLSGVLDYLEQYQTNENQALVASALYPFLCREFFPLPDNAVGDVQDALLCTVFQVLSESAISHPGNQHKLRDPNVLGGKRLGLMLRQCKDFVALEALLELVGNIIPSAKKTERRNKFIQEVFDPKEFACSLEIVQLLERVSCTGWDATSTKIFDALAKLDSSYPQPFETTQIRIQRASYIVSRIYADKNAFIASVAEDGQFETFQLPFHAVKRIQVSSPSAFMATVTVSVSSSPLLGHSLIIRDKTDDMSIAFDLRKEKIRDFATILRKRELRCFMGSSHEKQSKAERNVELSFDSRNKINPPPLEEKIENLTKLWESSKSPTDNNDQYVATSPLHISPSTISNKGEYVRTTHEPTQCMKTSNSPGISDSQDNKVIDLTKPQLDAIFGASDEELSEISDLEVPGKRTKSIEVRNKKCAEPIHAASLLSIPEKEKRIAKTGPSSRTRDSAELPSVLEVTQEVNDGQEEDTNRLAPRSLHHPISPTNSASNAMANCKYGRHVRKARITSMESDAGDTHLATSGGIASNLSRMPPLRGSVIGGNTKLYVEAASTAATRDTGAVASEFPVQGDKEIVAIQSNDKYDKHDQDIYEVLGPLRPNGVGTHAISATLDNGSGKADTEHALLKMTLSQREQSTFELIKPRKTQTQTDASHAKTLIDLTSDDVEDVDYGAEVLFQEDLMEAQAIKSTEQVDLSKKVKNVVPAMEASNSMTRVSLLRRAGEGEKVEDVTPTHATDPQGRKTATSRASVSFVVPTLMNGGTHTATEDEHTRFFVLRSRQKRHRTETNIQTQTSQRQSAESYFDRPKSQADADIIPRIAEVICQMHEAVVDNTARRFGDVRSDIHATRQKILEGTANNMQIMQRESARHYNEMVDLANEYLDHERKMVHALYQLLGSERDMVQGIRDIIQTHDRFSLSSKFPKTLLPTAPTPL